MRTDMLNPSHLEILAAGTKGVLATIRRNGRPQLSNVLYLYDPDEHTLLVSVTAGRAKTRNAQRDPRVSMHVTSTDFWTWVVADGEASFSPVATEGFDDATEELVRLYRGIAGEHPDWAEFRAAQVAEQRQVLRLHIVRTYGTPGPRS